MPPVTITADVLFHVFSTNQDVIIGQRSTFAETPHPGTGKKIEGWIWDKRTWPTQNELIAQSFAPSLWDPTSSGIDQDLLQSGFGDNNDLLLLDVEDVQVSGVEIWAPKINHGYFYSRDDEWFLYSDWYQTEYFTLANTVSGVQFLDLQYDFKPTIPIQVRQYLFDKINGRHEVSLDFRRKVEFTVSGAETPEFTVDTTFDPPRIFLDDIYNEPVGVPVTVSGQLLDLELLGVSDGTADQEFPLLFSPIDGSESVEVWTWSDVTDFPGLTTQWTTISGIEPFTQGDNDEVKVDYDTGKIVFGDFDGSVGAGAIPTIGNFVGIHYTKGIAALYEPEHTRDYILSHTTDADVNPVASSTHRGFVQIAIEAADPSSITLTADLPQINPFLIDLGNNVGELIAVVKNKAGAFVEGIDVTFEIIPPIVGTFGATATDVIGLTNVQGEAKTIYNSPGTILGAGIATIDAVNSGSDTIVTVEGLVDPGDLQSLFLYKVEISDEVLGIPASGVDDYYATYLTGEGIDEDPDGTAATRVFEEAYRTRRDLPKPPSYDVSDITTGKKTIILTTKAGGADVIETKTGEFDITNLPVDQLSPLFPDTITNVGTETSPILQMTYVGVTLEEPGEGSTRSYFAIGDSQTSIRAFVVNPRTNKKIFSNTIQMKVTIPDTVNGTFFCSDLNDLPQVVVDSLLQRVKDIDDIADDDIAATQIVSGFDSDYLEERLGITVSGVQVGEEDYISWVRRTRRGDTQGLLSAQIAVEYLAAGGDPDALGPEELELMACGEIPLGFRLKSTGISIAAILDQITFIDPNDHLPSDYFDVKSSIGTLGNQFNIGSII